MPFAMLYRIGAKSACISIQTVAIARSRPDVLSMDLGERSSTL